MKGSHRASGVGVIVGVRDGETVGAGKVFVGMTSVLTGVGVRGNGVFAMISVLVEVEVEGN